MSSTTTVAPISSAAPARRRLTVRFATWSARHPWWAIGGWVLLVLGCYLGGTAAGMSKATDAQLGTGESARAAMLIAGSALGDDQSEMDQVLITSATGGPLDLTAAQAAATDVRVRLEALPGVLDVGAGQPSADGTALLIPVHLAGDAALDPIRAATAGVAGDHPALRVEQTGGASIGAAVDETLSHDFMTALVISLPVTLLILLVAFGALTAAGVPVLLGVTSVLSAVGLYTAASHLFPDGGSTAELILLIGMAVGVDYSLFYLQREREERRDGRSGAQALDRAAATAGHAVVTSGFAVMVALAGLYLIGDANFAAMASGAILVVAVAVLGSLTVLPAMLSLLGDRVDRPRIPLLWRLTNSDRPPRMWPALLRPALRYPAVTLVVATAAMLVLALPARNLKLKGSDDSDLPRSMSTMQTYDRLQAAYPQSRTSHLVVVSSPPGSAAVTSAAIQELLRRSASDALLGGGSIEAQGDGIVLVDVSVPLATGTDQAKASLKHLRSDLLPETLGQMAGVDYAVTGKTAYDVDYVDRLSSRAPWVIAFVLLLTMLLMTWAFRSVVVGLVTIVVNMLSAAAAFGVLVLVFQHSWAEGLLGFTSSGAVVSWIPVFLFVILFGLSMDYHVLVLSRIREAVDRGLPLREALRHGIVRSAGVVTSAAAVMIGVFAIFAGLSLIEFKELGVGLAVAVLLDAVVVRIVILPALMALLGNANWWAPAFLRRPVRAARADDPADVPAIRH